MKRYNKGSVKERTAGQVMVAHALKNMHNDDMIGGHDIRSVETTPEKKTKLQHAEEKIENFSSSSSSAAPATLSEQVQDSSAIEKKGKNVYIFNFHN